MCVCFVIAGNKAPIQDSFSVEKSFEGEVRPSRNVPPILGIPFVSDQVHEGEIVRRLELARWGLVRVWSKGPKARARMINACSETVTQKPSFRTAAAKRRALIPANEYHELQKHEDGTKAPHYPHREEKDPMRGFAGLYEFWSDPIMTDRDQVQHVIDTIPQANLIPRIIGKEVGSIRNDGPQIIRAV